MPRDVVVTDVTLDSREATPGALFLACRGRTHHGLEFAPQAVARGARAVLCEPAPTSPPRSRFRLGDLRRRRCRS